MDSGKDETRGEPQPAAGAFRRRRRIVAREVQPDELEQRVEAPADEGDDARPRGGLPRDANGESSDAGPTRDEPVLDPTLLSVRRRKHHHSFAYRITQGVL